jgi:hypothetical protein
MRRRDEAVHKSIDFTPRFCRGCGDELDPDEDAAHRAVCPAGAAEQYREELAEDLTAEKRNSSRP